MPIEANSNYIVHNTEQTKNVVVAVKIDGVDEPFTSTVPIVPIRYGDPITYGEDGIVYGGYRHMADGEYRAILSLQGSSLTISQKLEPEQGRASVSTLTLAFIDKDQYMTQLISPGVIIEDILGTAVDVFLGYQGLNFPDDYLRVFRGYVSNYSAQAGLITLQLSDPNSRRRQQIFSTAKTTLASGIDNAVTTLPVVGTGDFYQSILGPNGSSDPNVAFYVLIDQEFISYTGLTSSTLTGCVRGVRGTTPDAHTAGSDVTGYIEFWGHSIDLALKLMLSGWGGPYETNVPVYSFGNVPDVGFVANTIVLPAGKDAVQDYGLTSQDYITITGATNPGNDQTVQVVGFTTIQGQENRGIRTTGSFTAEDSSPAVLSLRSQFDTFPVLAGMRLSPKDVDVATHLSLKDTFLGSDDYSYRFFISDVVDSGKTFLESQIYLPYGMYSLTKRGLLSVGLTKPPIGGATLPVLTQDNVLNPESIRITRGTNNRKFFNEVQVNFDLSDDGSTYSSVFSFIDTDSLNINSGGISFVLPINSDGARSDPYDASTTLSNQARLILRRYSRGAIQLTCKVNWGIGNLIEAGDIVAVQDLGGLQISNINTGVRQLGTQLFEVQDRKLDLASGNISIELISGVGGEATDRYGVISPSSVIASAASPSQITLQDSYGALFPGAEGDKWVSYIGQRVIIHSEDYSVSEETTLFSQDVTNTYTFTLNPPLSFTPPSGYILDVPAYPTSVDQNQSILYKSSFAFFDPQVAVSSGTSNTQFDVSSGDASKFFIGSVVRVHSADYSVDSGDVTVSDVSGTTITVEVSLGFTPSSADFVDLIGFPDHGGAYRFI